MDECWDGILPKSYILCYAPIMPSEYTNARLCHAEKPYDYMIRAEKADICRAIISFVRVWQIVMDEEG